ncbi:MAG: lactonase family protein [Lachnospiraceae bacterium]|jgi:6-phosphogluconolactonase|nr:lactonase family protein [Lachnospiraceae bacterium]MBO6089363.1 lactonase family protein [Lachnospiraceae bacterium]
MRFEKYVAYVSSYTKRNKMGITIFDVDIEKGTFIFRNSIEISNSSYLTSSHNDQFLYSITDMGVKSYEIGPNGDLDEINFASVNGMRGCYLSTDYTDRYLFVAGYHDGKITVLRVGEDGAVGEITDEIYVQGMGEVSDRSYVPHVSCVKMSRDNKFLLASDTGMDHVNVYALNYETGKLKPVDIIRSDVNSGPRHMIFSVDNKYVYVLNEMQNSVDVFTYTALDSGYPEFEKIQTIQTVDNYHASMSVSRALKFSEDRNYIVTSSAGDNSVEIFKRDEETGLLTKILWLPISGSYPKDAALFPDKKHLVSLNHESSTLTFFNVDLEKGLLSMCAKEVKIDYPNCVIFHGIK